MRLVIGAQGGVGTTRITQALVKAGDAIALDLADGQLAARLERTTWPLAWLTLVAPAQRQTMIETIVQRRFSLAWSPECRLNPTAVWAAVREVDVRRPVIIDGGIAPPDEAAQQAEAIIIVSADNDVARWHTRRLSAQYPQATVTLGTKDAARTLAAQMFPTSAELVSRKAAKRQS